MTRSDGSTYESARCDSYLSEAELEDLLHRPDVYDFGFSYVEKDLGKNDISKIGNGVYLDLEDCLAVVRKYNSAKSA